MDFQLIASKFWWVLAISLVREATSLKGPWITVPHLVKAGDTVTLFCKYNLENIDLYALKWYRDHEEFFRYTPRVYPSMMYFPTKNIEVDISKSGANQVTLKNVVKEQSGNYECEVSTEAPRFETGYQSSSMQVVEIPLGDPSIKINQSSVAIGAKLYAECSVAGSHPPANISWSINDKEVHGNNQTIEIKTHSSQNTGQLNGVSESIEVITEPSNFLQGVLSLKCEANVYDLWNRSTEIQVKESVPAKLIEALTVGSVSSQKNQSNDGDSNKNI